MTLAELGRYASAEKLIPNAPIRAYLKNAKLKGPFRAGAKLTYGGFFKHDLRIAKIEQGELVMIYGTLAGYTGITRWDVTRISAGQTKVAFTESLDGFLIATLSSKRSLETHLQKWLDKLKAEVERLS